MAEPVTPPGPGGPAPAGSGIVKASVASTAAFTVAAAAGVLAPDTFAVVTAVVSCVAFVAGCVVFLWAYALALNRSRTEAIGIGGLYFLAGTGAPAPVRRRLLASLAAQVVVALLAASLRIYTAVAFGILVPVLGLGLSGLWAARHGSFPARSAKE